MSAGGHLPRNRCKYCGIDEPNGLKRVLQTDNIMPVEAITSYFPDTVDYLENLEHSEVQVSLPIYLCIHSQNCKKHYHIYVL